MNQKTIGTLLWVISAVLLFLGFRFVTQAGQASVIQNDGYAVTGGVLIVLGGFLLGVIWSRSK